MNLHRYREPAEIQEGDFFPSTTQTRFRLGNIWLILACISLSACAEDGSRTTNRPIDNSKVSDAMVADANSIDAGIAISDAFTQDARVVDAGFGMDAANTDAEPTDTGMSSPAMPPNQAGDKTWSTTSDTITRGSRRIPVETYLPDGVANAPVVVFIPGFQLESRRYQPLMEHLASHGFVVLRTDPPDPLLSVSHTEMSADVSAVLDWALNSQRSFSNQIDSSKIASMGHSLGGKVATMAAHNDSRITALLGLDPVNGEHPQNGYTSDIPDILPAQVSNLAIPIGLMGETTDDGSAGGGMACAPAATNFTHFFDAAQTSNWIAEWDIAGADHMDFVDDTSLCFSCGFCRNGTADKNDVLLIVRTLSAAFFRYHFKGDSAVLPWLVGAELDTSITIRSRP